jgi:hypothetical protein
MTLAPSTILMWRFHVIKCTAGSSNRTHVENFVQYSQICLCPLNEVTTSYPPVFLWRKFIISPRQTRINHSERETIFTKFIQIRAVGWTLGRKTKRWLSAHTQILFVCPDLVPSPRQNGVTDLAEIWWIGNRAFSVGSSVTHLEATIFSYFKDANF